METTPGDTPTPAWSQANDTVERNKWKRVVKCPSCRTNSIRIDFDTATNRIIHRCTNSNCAFLNGILPVYVIDNEIYRYLPSVVVGTIDKLAALGNQAKMSMLFGKIDGKCPVHGYYLNKCCQKDCAVNIRQLQPGIPQGLSGPTLFIQDELHLLREGLGTFDSHYETFSQRLLQEFNHNSNVKIIASSATIEAFERQVQHLYGKSTNDARVFPGPGPTITSSFYAETMRYPQRLYIGVIPHNKTIFNAILELIEYFHETMQILRNMPIGSQNPYHGSILPGTSDWQQLIDLYSTSLTYFSNGRDLNSIRTDIESDVNTSLQSKGLLPIDISELTGATGTDEVTSTLEHLETPASITENPNAVLATSMISHGVDVNRFNFMLFYGMPRQNSEYIQSSSRVGRSHVGIVFNCLHPIRERDRSHYSYFGKFHEFLGQLVEPVAINRWSKFSIQRTLPGLFMSVLLQILSHLPGVSNPGMYYRADFIKQKISSGRITANDFIPILEDAYVVTGNTSPEATAFRQEISRLVQQNLDFIVAGTNISWVSEALIPSPMTSLREVDERIEIELDNDGTMWANRISQP